MATYTNFDDEIFVQAALQGYVNVLAPFNAFSTDYGSATIDRKGDTVLVPLIASLTATTFSAYNICGGTLSAITVSINKHKHVPVGQNDLTAASSSMANLEKFGYQMGAGLGLLVFQDIWTLVTTGNFTLATAVSVVDFKLAQIQAGRLMLSQNKVPQVGRNLILDCSPFDNLLGISNFILANQAGDAQALREGKIGRALGLDIYETTALPGTNSVMGFFAHSSAIAIASRYLRPQRPEAYIDARPVTDPVTGLTLGFRRHYDPNTGTEYVNLECNYGFSKGITNGGRVLHRLD